MTAHTDRAQAVAQATGWDLDDCASDHGWAAVGLGPVGQHRDSGALERSNYRVVLADLKAKFGDAVAEASFGHWGVGWVEEIVWDASREDVREHVESWELALSDYPCASEEDFSALEHEELEQWCESLRLEDSYEGIDYVWNPFIESIGAEIAGVLTSKLEAFNVESTPGDDAIAQACIEAGVLVVDVEPLQQELAAAREDAQTLRDMIEDHARGLLDLSELVRRAGDFATA